MPRYVVTLDAESLDPSSRACVDIESLRDLCARVLEEEEIEDASALTIVFADDELLRSLNRKHRDLDAPTDVLSFPAWESGLEADGELAPPEVPRDADDAGSYIGDIAISVETAARQAAEANLTIEQELAHLVLHGLLHIIGYDHETPEDDAEMREREEGILGHAIHASNAHADD
ncbi:MAG: rRNA maturation RNase YbeY [Dehalococcoidia bacterium]|nr:rRNA maturation RNase YbeY [Dehalococcoidia bacterium]